VTRRRGGILVLAALLMGILGPALFAPSTRFVGSEYLDTHGTQWFYWWLGEWFGALPDPPPAHLFYPWGKAVYSHTGGNLLDALIALPLRAAFGPVMGTNLLVVGILATNGWGASRLAWALGARGAGLWLAGTLGLIHPFALFELENGRPTQAMLIFPALFLAALLGPKSRGAGVRAGLFLALSGLTYWYYGLVGALVGAVAWFANLAGRRRWQSTGRVTITAVVALLCVAPFVVPMVMGLAEGAVPGLLALTDEPGALGRLRLYTEEGDPQGLFVVDVTGRLGALMDRGGLRFESGVRVIGPLALVLAAVGAARGGARARVAALALVATLVVAAGPLLILEQDYIANPPYLFLVERWDVLRRWWWPGRALGFSLLLVAGLAGRVVRPNARGLAAAIAGLAFILALRSGVLPLTSWDATVSPAMRCLAARSAVAVVELPYTLGQRPLYHQTIHEQPMLNGMLVSKLAFAPTEVVALRRDNTFIRMLLALGDRDWKRARTYEEADFQAARALGYGVVLFRKDGFVRPRPQGDGSTRMESDWPRARRINAEVDVLGLPEWEDDQIAVYTLDGTAFPCVDE
jgi:hypothetical protein